MSKKITTPETQTQTQTKPSWNNCAGCELYTVESKECWRKTKYKHKNIPEDHFVEDFSVLRARRGNASIPGIVANKLFEFAKDQFILNKEYDYNQIHDMCGGVLWGVSERTDDTIEVIFMSYDHHNEPIETEKLALVKS